MHERDAERRHRDSRKGIVQPVEKSTPAKLISRANEIYASSTEAQYRIEAGAAGGKGRSLASSKARGTRRTLAEGKH